MTILRLVGATLMVVAVAACSSDTGTKEGPTSAVESKIIKPQASAAKPAAEAPVVTHPPLQIVPESRSVNQNSPSK